MLRQGRGPMLMWRVDVEYYRGCLSTVCSRWPKITTAQAQLVHLARRRSVPGMWTSSSSLCRNATIEHNCARSMTVSRSHLADLQKNVC